MRNIQLTPVPTPYKPRHHVRIVTAASLFDGHDAAINVMRRIMQASGAEIIHLGHNRSVAEIVDCAIQEDAQGIAITSYQGGHVEFFKYMIDLLRERGANIKVFGGGGGTILPAEIEELHRYGVTRIYSPDDGRALGLQGMIDDLISKCDFEKRSPDFAPLLAERPQREAVQGRPAHHHRGELRLRGRRPARRALQAQRRRSARPRAGHHRYRWRGQVEPGGRAGPALPRGLPRQDARGALHRSVQAQVRRRAARRPHPHERDRQPARLHALDGHAPEQPRPVASTSASRSRSARPPGSTSSSWRRPASASPTRRSSSTRTPRST